MVRPSEKTEGVFHVCFVCDGRNSKGGSLSSLVGECKQHGGLARFRHKAARCGNIVAEQAYPPMNLFDYHEPALFG